MEVAELDEHKNAGRIVWKKEIRWQNDENPPSFSIKEHKHILVSDKIKRMALYSIERRQLLFLSNY